MARTTVPARKTPDPDPILTAEEAAEELKVPLSTFYGWIRRGEGPEVLRLPGKNVRIERSAFETWKASRRTAA